MSLKDTWIPQDNTMEASPDVPNKLADAIIANEEDIDQLKEKFNNLDVGGEVDLSNYYTKNEVDEGINCAKYFAPPKIGCGVAGALIDINHTNNSAPYITIPADTHFIWDDYLVYNPAAVTINLRSTADTSIQAVLIKKRNTTTWGGNTVTADDFVVIRHGNIPTTDWSQYRFVCLVRTRADGVSLDIDCGYTINGSDGTLGASIGANAVIYLGNNGKLYIERGGGGIYVRPENLSLNSINIAGIRGANWTDVCNEVGSANVVTSPNGKEQCLKLGVNTDGQALCYNVEIKKFAVVTCFNIDTKKLIPLVYANYGAIGGKLIAHMNNTAFERLDTLEKSTNIVVPTTTAQTEKVKAFSALFNNTDKVESFLFFTDPHLAEGSGDWETGFKQYLGNLKSINDTAPTSFVVCGGDWLGNSDLMTGACYKLGYIDSYMKENFRDYHLVVGNHDTNYQGKLEEGSANYTGTLSHTTLKNLWYRDTQNAYYRFEGTHSDYYVLNTLFENSVGTTDYEKEQLHWFAASLKENNYPHTAIFMHMYINHIYDDGTVSYSTLSSIMGEIIATYNSRGKGEFDGVDYDFSSCTGHIDYVMCGHAHKDYIETIGGIPCIITTKLKDSSTPTFDLCLADYDNNKLHLVRIGSGSDRTIDI